MDDVLFLLDPLNRSTFLTPFVRVQLILQTQDLIGTVKQPIRGVFNCFSQLWKRDLFFNHWRGGLAYFFCSTSGLFLEHLVNETVKEIKSPDDDIWRYVRNKPDLFVLGVIAGWNLIFHPFEVLRVRLACENLFYQEIKYSLFGKGRQIFKKEGIRSLYRGYIPMTAYMVMQKDVFYKKAYFKMNPREISLRLIRDVTLYPLLVLSHRMIMSESKTEIQNMMGCCKKAFRKFGVQGFYKGFQMALFVRSTDIPLYFYFKDKEWF